MKRLYNVRTTAVTLLWADTPEEAQQKADDAIRRCTGFDIIPDDDHAPFVSEAVPSMGWDGEKYYGG